MGKGNGTGTVLGSYDMDMRSLEGDTCRCVDVSWYMHVLGGRLETLVSLGHVVERTPSRLNPHYYLKPVKYSYPPNSHPSPTWPLFYGITTSHVVMSPQQATLICAQQSEEPFEELKAVIQFSSLLSHDLHHLPSSIMVQRAHGSRASTPSDACQTLLQRRRSAVDAAGEHDRFDKWQMRTCCKKPTLALVPVAVSCDFEVILAVKDGKSLRADLSAHARETRLLRIGFGVVAVIDVAVGVAFAAYEERLCADDSQLEDVHAKLCEKGEQATGLVCGLRVCDRRSR